MYNFVRKVSHAFISIHAPRVGSDALPIPTAASSIQFQSTLPVWGATITLARIMLIPVFQSTLPVWGATNVHEVTNTAQSISIHAPRVGSDVDSVENFPELIYFNPRSPCGERLCGLPRGHQKIHISIHAPRVGSDRHARMYPGRLLDFNPRSPCGERPGS